jgi:ubiquinone biosynthesis protein
MADAKMLRFVCFEVKPLLKAQGRGAAVLSERLIPTPLVADRERPPIPLDPPLRVRLRVARCCWALLRWGLALLSLKLTGRWTSETAARRTRGLFEQLGFLWIKVGQFLSLRTDLFSAALCRELAGLQHRVHGFPAAVARSVVETELGRPIAEVFTDFAERPFAAASIAQLHRARLRSSGQAVVLKVMRPGTAAVFAADLRFLTLVVRLLRRMRRLRNFRFEEALWEIREIADEETSYFFEAANLKRFRRSVRRHGIYVPKPFPKLSTRYLLVMEEIPAVVMTDYIRVAGEEPARAAAWRQENQVDAKLVAERLFLSLLRQIFEDNLFHGDLHPGNVMLLRHSRVALIDLGTLSRLDLNLLRRYFFGLRAIALGDYHQVAYWLLSIVPGASPDLLCSTTEEMVRILRAWEKRTTVRSLPYHEKSISKLFTDLARVLARANVATTWEILRIDRSLMTLDASLHVLFPDVDYRRLLQRYYLERSSRTLLHTLDVKGMLDAPTELSALRTMVEPVLRRDSLRYEVGVSPAARLFAIFSRIFSFVSLACWAGLAVLILDQRYELLPPAEEAALRPLEARLPELGLPAWGGVMALCLLIPYLGRVAARVLEQPQQGKEPAP